MVKRTNGNVAESDDDVVGCSTINMKSDPIFSTILLNEIIPLKLQTIGSLRDQILKVKKCNYRQSHCLKLYCEYLLLGYSVNTIVVVTIVTMSEKWYIAIMP